MYCKKCRLLFESGTACPLCGKEKNVVEQPEEEDLCLLTEQSSPFSDMFENVLQQNDIPYVTENPLGAALGTYLGAFLTSKRFYVQFRDLPRATTMTEQFFGQHYKDVPTPIWERDEDGPF